MGFKGEDDLQLSISDGIVLYNGLDSMRITADAKEGFSGSPVLSASGFIAGMVTGSDDKRVGVEVEVVCVQSINIFLTSNGLPGFC